MKITKFFALMCAVATIAVGCDKPGNPETPAPQPIPEPDPTATLEIEVVKSRITIGDEIQFIVTMNGTPVTEAKTLEIYDASTYDPVSNPYKPTEIGRYEFYAMYGPLVTNVHAFVEVLPVMEEIPADPQPENTKFNHRILLIDHTGSSCGYCPLMMTALKQLSEDSDYNTKYNEVTAHYGSLATNDNARSDAASIVGGNIAAYVKGFPALTYNLCEEYVASYSLSTIKNGINKLWKEDGAEAGIAAYAALAAEKVTVNYEIKTRTEQEYRVAAWLLESDIYSAQNGASADWQNYAHNAIRNITGYNGSNDISGESIGTVKVGEPARGTLEIPIISPKWVTDNMSVLIIVTAANERYQGKFEVVNTAICELGKGVEYEYMAE